MNTKNLTSRFQCFFQILALTSVLFLNQASAKTCVVSSHAGEIESLVAYKQAISNEGCKQGDVLWIEILGGKTASKWDYRKEKLHWLYWLRANVCSLDKHSYVNEVNGWAGLTCIYREAG